VNRTERVDAVLDETSRTLARGDVVGVDDGLAALLADLVDDLLGLVTVQVVHHDRGALLGQMQAVATSDAAPAARHHDGTAVQNPHGVVLLNYETDGIEIGIRRQSGSKVAACALGG
jgi:hypothetical protein